MSLREEIAILRRVAQDIQRGHPEAAEYYRGYLDALHAVEGQLPEADGGGA